MMIELFTRKYPGMRIWLSQRLTAVVMAGYIVLLIIALLLVKPNHYGVWHAFASSFLFKIGTFFFFLCLCIHAWLGMRDVLRDYVSNQRLRDVMQIMIDILLVMYLVWLSMVLWGQ